MELNIKFQPKIYANIAWVFAIYTTLIFGNEWNLDLFICEFTVFTSNP